MAEASCCHPTRNHEVKRHDDFYGFGRQTHLAYSQAESTNSCNRLLDKLFGYHQPKHSKSAQQLQNDSMKSISHTA